MSEIPIVNSFVNIETLFEREQERSISLLSELYLQPNLLKEKIRKISKGVLDNHKILEGKKILLKPNWVTHNRKENDEICLRTHNSILLSLVEIILECKPLKITIGDAPIQGCNWEKMISQDFYKSIERLSITHSIPIIIKDFRRVTFIPLENNLTKERNAITNYTIFDLGKESCLEPISSTKNIFRVTDYDPDRLSESHTVGKHKYCITNELFDADTVISLPKIKTHQKTGITGALKNLVGLNGDKDFLPHHRVGGSGVGGDCYPGKNILRRISEFFLDYANRHQGENKYWVGVYLSKIAWKLSLPKNVHHLAAGWFGNDTTWRMVMDLNKIAIFGKKDGTISGLPQRELYSLCDGIIGGQGDGPLNPQPLAMGVICFTNNSSMTDICMATLMGFDIQKIPLLKIAEQNIKRETISLILNGRLTTIKEISKLSIPTLPPPGWVDYLSKP
ncbi:MAG: DUF362 domain-containing protein [Bacteroidales bacterium]|nr:DUF362 domain-containing protein [Bacteroidales bacterium]